MGWTVTAAQWEILIPALAGFLSGVGALLHSMATRRQMNRKP